MDKRTFLKTSSILATGTAFTSLMSCDSSTTTTNSANSSEPLTNWAGNLTYSAKKVHYPTSVAEIQELVRAAAKLRGLGSRHSFNKIADSKQSLISLKGLNEKLSLDSSTGAVTVEAGVRYGDVCEYLHENGFALHNLASLPHISIAGACATATHGSGVKNGGLAIAVSGMELVKADGTIVTLSREKDKEVLDGSVVGLGGLGIITKVTLDLIPTFQMRQVVYRNMPMSALETNFDTVMSSGYSVSLFTDWRNKNINQVWIKSLAEAPQTVSGKDFFGATLADRDLHPVEDLSAENCTQQMDAEGSWYERLPHFKMGFTPSSGEELQAEYFVPMEHGYKAMMVIEKMNEKISPHLFISEIRTIDQDDLWMSPCYKKPCVAFHFTFKPEWDAVQRLLPMIEEGLAPYHVRPHWGKLFSLSPKVLQSRVEKLADFKELLSEFDPEGKFRNEFLDRNIFT